MRTSCRRGSILVPSLRNSCQGNQGLASIAPFVHWWFSFLLCALASYGFSQACHMVQRPCYWCLLTPSWHMMISPSFGALAQAIPTGIPCLLQPDIRSLLCTASHSLPSPPGNLKQQKLVHAVVLAVIGGGGGEKGDALLLHAKCYPSLRSWQQGQLLGQGAQR